MPDLLLELFSEEIPARMQARAADDLRRLVCDGLGAAELAFGKTEVYATPRRLCLHVTDIPAVQPDRKQERKGPKVDAPEKAIEGFLGSVGMTRDQLEIRQVKNAEFYFAVIEQSGGPTADVIAEIVQQTVRDFPWPKSMRWGAGNLRWVRPLHAILCCFDGAPLSFEIDGIVAGDTTYGHRFMAPEAIVARDFATYKAALAAAHVRLDPAERAAHILACASGIAAENGLTLIEDAALLTEVAGLNEWPVPLLGRFDPAFLAVPPEVLTTAMRAHQKYFSLRDKDTGKLAPFFITAANIEARDGGARIVAGNERVLAARLSDAKFFWDQDRKKPLEARVDQLADMVFHAKLGSVRDKVARMVALSGRLAGLVPGADRADAERAALLAKADLVSEMVFEFPELQGIMGRYYALADGESASVADAIYSHYSPAGPSDDCPDDPTAIVVALADKLDTLVEFWRIGEKPTGSKDPFALRRAALGVIRLVLENGLRLPLAPLFGAQAEDLLGFFADRLKVHLRGEGVRHDLIDAVFALGDQDDLVLLVARVRALEAFLQSDDGANLLAAYKRAANILRIEEKRDAASYDGHADPALFAQDEERALFDQIAEAAAEADAALARDDFTAAMGAVARLRMPVDAFFDKVTVNADQAERRANRLRLLSQIRGALEAVADFSKIEG